MVEDESIYPTNLTVRDMTMYIYDEDIVTVWANVDGRPSFEFEGRWKVARKAYANRRLTGIRTTLDVVDDPKYDAVYKPFIVIDIA